MCIGLSSFLLRVRGHSAAGTRVVYRKPGIIVYKVINMDIFLIKTHRFTSEGLY